MRIQITQHHINRGLRGSTTKDPVALAMLDAGFKNPWASPSHLWVEFEDRGLRVETPESVLQFMKSFDNENFVEPFEFELEVQ